MKWNREDLILLWNVWSKPNMFLLLPRNLNFFPTWPQVLSVWYKEREIMLYPDCRGATPQPEHRNSAGRIDLGWRGRRIKHGSAARVARLSARLVSFPTQFFHACTRSTHKRTDIRRLTSQTRQNAHNNKSDCFSVTPCVQILSRVIISISNKNLEVEKVS